MAKKTLRGKHVKNQSALPKTPPVHEEPLRGIDLSKVNCEICGKAFSNKSQLGRHMVTQHESTEGKE